MRTTCFLHRGVLAALAAGLLAACATDPFPPVVDVREVSAGGGTPQITRLVDLGAGRVPRLGPLLAPHTDGRAVIGELLLVEGKGLGKQPTLTVGGAPARVLGHTKGGGVIVRVPWGIDPGMVTVEASSQAGRATFSYPVERLGLVATGGRTVLFELTAAGEVKPRAELLQVPARLLALSPDGSLAFAAGEVEGIPRIWVLDLSFTPPKVAAIRDLPGERVVDLAFAEQGELGVVLTDSHIIFMLYSGEVEPAFNDPLPLPEELAAKRPLAVALDGSGKTLAVLLAELNEVAVLDSEVPHRLGKPSLARVRPSERLSVVLDLRFSSDGGTLLVLSGDTERSIAGGHVPAAISALGVRQPAAGAIGRELTLGEDWQLTADLAPGELAVARGEPVPSGTAIRSEPTAQALYFSAVKSGLLQQGLPGLAAAGKEAGAVVRSTLSGPGELLLGGAHLPVALDLVGKTQRLLVLAVTAAKGQAEQLLLVQPAWGKGQTHRLPLGPLPTGAPMLGGSVRAQP